MFNVYFSNSLKNNFDFDKLSEFLKFQFADNFFIKENYILILKDNEFLELEKDFDAFYSKNKNFNIILYSNKLYEKEYIFDIVDEYISILKLSFIINKAYINLKNIIELENLRTKVYIQSKELKILNSIGISLSTEKDVDKLLETILYKCREITCSDSGSLYLIEEIKDIEENPNNYFENKKLVFKLAQNDSIKVDFEERVLELNKKSIAAYVALTGKPLLIDDAYNIPKEAEYSHNRSFDESIGYHCKSMLIVPMKNQKDEIIGVVQLINKKKKFNIKLLSEDIINKNVLSYTNEDYELVYSLASQSAILVDNTKLYYNIKHLFEGFIKASVTAIESRDPTTSGHSQRVADLTVGLAEAINKIKNGNLAKYKFSRNDLQQIKYASLLHDFGKIGVREDVLVKAKKLYPYELNEIVQRFKYIKKCMELNLTKAKLNYVLKNGNNNFKSYFEEIEIDYNKKIEEVNNYLNIIIASNEPSILPQEVSDKLKLLNSLYFEDEHEKVQYLTNYELESLSILKGSLRDNERLEIESHVTHTYIFLSKIPWTSEFKKVPDIAYSHHEKLDGTGYPRRIKSDDIPFPSKMMAISDIYDALTASDRPYKKALPPEKAIDILGFEVKANKLDKDIYKVFVEAKIYELTRKG
ncbi:MAG: HD family phosphohydrolase [Candidatus Sericytochromatia bacterium]|nr:MAG: HD family phosphohydrolase [Candidatus Sericytochromatia bacterium]